MKRLLIIALLIVGCDKEEPEAPVVLGSCVIRAWHELGYTSTAGLTGAYKYKCYEGVYTKKECMDKTVTVASSPSDDVYTYSYYDENETCAEYCARDDHDRYGWCDEY